MNRFVRTPSFARGRGVDKTTCRTCQRNVHVIVDDEGTQHLVDPELIAVVVEHKGDAKRTTTRMRMHAHRIHAEQCAKYKADDERKAWALEQKRLTRKPTVREVRAQQKAANAAKRAGITSGQVAPSLPPKPKYATIADARKAVLAHYKTVEHERSRA